MQCVTHANMIICAVCDTCRHDHLYVYVCDICRHVCVRCQKTHADMIICAVCDTWCLSMLLLRSISMNERFCEVQGCGDDDGGEVQGCGDDDDGE